EKKSGRILSERRVLHKADNPERAFWFVKKIRDAQFGPVSQCRVLKPSSRGRARPENPGGNPRGSPPILWEITDDFVAIKQVKLSRVREGYWIEDPFKEVAAMQYVGDGHPNVLGCMEALQDDQFLYVVTKYCRKGDLMDVIENCEISTREPLARFWFRQLLAGLHFLQSKGVCHRDLSPENILLDDDDCLIIDLGMCLRVPFYGSNNDNFAVDASAFATRRLIKPQGTCGKMGYMSPEIYNNEVFDGFAVDLWGAGTTLYSLLTGYKPYETPSLENKYFSTIANGNLLRQLRDWNVDISDEAGKLLQWMLTLNPRNRPTLAQVMDHEWVVKGDVQPPSYMRQSGKTNESASTI
ncbi:hypothetical protein ACHAXS_001100, partial [Conticribra weissflogii]